MALGDLSPSRSGQDNGAGSVDEIFLMQFSGEVITAYDETNVFGSRSLVRNISSGKSAQFPATWKAVARYHTPGALIVGQAILSGERTILIDDLLISDVAIASIDEAKSHFDFRQPYTKQLGAALARSWDTNVAQVGVLAARAAATMTGANGGTVINGGVAVRTTMSLLVASLSAAAIALDEKDVPETDRYAFLKPAVYGKLVASAEAADFLTQDEGNGGNGSRASGKINRIFGLELVKTNNLPSTNVATGPTAYQGDFTNTAALVMHKDAVGTVKLLDLSVEMEWLIQYQTNLVLAKYAIGHGILRPECAVEVAAVA
jgi:hypothetical protein